MEPAAKAEVDPEESAKRLEMNVKRVSKVVVVDEPMPSGMNMVSNIPWDRVRVEREKRGVGGRDPPRAESLCFDFDGFDRARTFWVQQPRFRKLARNWDSLGHQRSPSLAQVAPLLLGVPPLPCYGVWSLGCGCAWTRRATAMRTHRRGNSRKVPQVFESSPSGVVGFAVSISLQWGGYHCRIACHWRDLAEAFLTI